MKKKVQKKNYKMPEEKETEKKKEPILVRYIRDRIHNKNKNFVMLFVGATGSGKSYSALRLAEMLDDTFNIDRCCFKAKDFMNLINSLVESNDKVSGKVILWDEFGVEHNAREFMTISNRVINYFFQTSRHLNLIVIMTVPLLSFIDSATRKLCHCVAEMQSINSRTKQASLKVKMLQTNVMTGKEYPKYLRYRKNSKMLVSKKLKFNLPSKELIEAYEEKKKAFTSELNKEIMNKLLKVEVKGNITKALTPLQEQILECLKQGIKKQKDIGDKLGKPQSQIAVNMMSLRKKGYQIGKYGDIIENRDINATEPQL